jgi:hypothetical protein
MRKTDRHAQIGGDRLTLRDDARGLLVDLFVQRVDGGVAFADAFRQFGVAGLQCLGRFRDCVFDQAAHAHDVGLDRFEVAVERGDDMFRRSHVLCPEFSLSRSGR